MTPEQTKVVEKCCRMLKRSLRNMKRVVFHLAKEDEEDTVNYEVHGKVKIRVEEQ